MKKSFEQSVKQIDEIVEKPKITTIKGTAINSITIILIHNKLIKPPFNTPLRPNTPM